VLQLFRNLDFYSVSALSLFHAPSVTLAPQRRSFLAQLGLDIELASRRVEDFCSSICVGIFSVLSMVPGGVSGRSPMGPRHRLGLSSCRGFVRVLSGRFCCSAPLGVSGWSLRLLWDPIGPSFSYCFIGFSLVFATCCISWDCYILFPCLFLLLSVVASFFLYCFWYSLVFSLGYSSSVLSYSSRVVRLLSLLVHISLFFILIRHFHIQQVLSPRRRFVSFTIGVFEKLSFCVVSRMAEFHEYVVS
jgi:hypothetical protein